MPDRGTVTPAKPTLPALKEIIDEHLHQVRHASTGEAMGFLGLDRQSSSPNYYAGNLYLSALTYLAAERSILAAWVEVARVAQVAIEGLLSQAQAHPNELSPEAYFALSQVLERIRNAPPVEDWLP